MNVCVYVRHNQKTIAEMLIPYPYKGGVVNAKVDRSPELNDCMLALIDSVIRSMISDKTLINLE